MIPPVRRIERLGPDHDVTEFDSGRQELDVWIQRHGLVAQRMDTARSFVLVEDGGVVGYFSLTMGAVRREEPPPGLVRGTPAYPLGMVLIARLAVDRRWHGRGLGAQLLFEALRRAAAAGEVAAARLVVVDAVDVEAAAFYRRFGFEEAPGYPLRHFRRMKDVRASLDRASET